MNDYKAVNCKNKLVDLYGKKVLNFNDIGVISSIYKELILYKKCIDILLNYNKRLLEEDNQLLDLGTIYDGDKLKYYNSDRYLFLDDQNKYYKELMDSLDTVLKVFEKWYPDYLIKHYYRCNNNICILFFIRWKENICHN